MAEPLNDTLGFVIHDVARMMRWHFDRRAHEIGLTRAQCSVLAQLWRNDGVQQNKLAEQMDITAITLTGLLDRLERDGWVERRPDPEDRRAKRIFLTERVTPVVRKIRTLGKDVRELALQGLSDAEEQELMTLLVKVRSNLSSR